MLLAARAQRIIPVDGVIQLPSGTRLDAIRLSGNDLLVTLPDGQVLIIVDGALHIPQIKIGTINIPAPTVAALIAGQEPEPATGAPPSSGGNFEQTPGDIGNAFGLGDLLPSTDFALAAVDDSELIPDAIDNKPAILITTPDQPAGAASATATVAEAALPARGTEPAGSDQVSEAETISGTIEIRSIDGPSTVSIGGTAVTVVGQTIATPLGLITVTSIAPSAIGYSYRLTDNTTAADAKDIVEIIVTDRDGDVATATLTLNISDDTPTARADIDDVLPGTYTPQTGNVISGAGTATSAAGADTPGADGALVTGIAAGEGSVFSPPGAPIAGQYGRLLITADGTYIYLRNSGTPGGVSDVFTYRLTDGDGDTATATLTIRIGDSAVSIVAPVPGEDGTRVEEAGLSERDDGGAPGSRSGDSSDVTTGVIAFKAPDGPAKITIEGVEITDEGQTIELERGTLYVISINPDSIEYAFVLATNSIGSATQPINVTVTDRDGDSASTRFVIDIIDDAPAATADIDRVPAGSFAAATGNVITDAENDGGADLTGADGAVVTLVTGASGSGTAGVPIAGLYGVLTLLADGSYSYVRNAGSAGGVNDVFTYQLTDGDGDTASATLTIAIGDGGVTLRLPNGSDDGRSVAEAGLAVGSYPASGTATTSGAISYTVVDGLGKITIGGVEVTAIGQLIAGNFGTLTITGISAGSITYSYTLTDPASSDDAAETFAVVVTDLDGDRAIGTLSIAIVDDVPTAVDEEDFLETSGAGRADGNVLTGAGGSDANPSDGSADTAGADGASVTAVTFEGASGEVDGLTAGAYGTLELESDGRYVYVVDPDNIDVQGLDSDDVLVETFTYTITDGDGDQATATLTLTIRGRDDGVAITGLSAAGGELTVSEANLPGGTVEDLSALIQSGSFDFSAVDGAASIKIGGQTLFDGSDIVPGLTIVTNLGILTITGFDGVYDSSGELVAGTVSYSYELTANSLLHTGAANTALRDSFVVTITDSDGSAATSSLDVTIVDDAPIAHPEPSITVAEDAPAITGDLLENDSGGADGAVVTSVTIGSVTIAIAAAGTTEYTNSAGTYSFEASGAWSFNPAVQTSVFPVHADFTYTITDGDGDTSSAVQQIRVADGAGPTASAPITLTVDDQHLESGSSPSSQPVSASGTIHFAQGSDAIVSIGFGDLAGLDGGLSWELESETRIIGLDADLNPVVVLELGVSGNSATVTATLVQNYGLHPDVTRDDLADLGSIAVVALDADGDAASGIVHVAVSDDVPQITAAGSAAGLLTVDETSLGTDATADIRTLFNLVLGADQAGGRIDYRFDVTTASGLTDVATGSKIILQANGNVVEGRLLDVPSTIAFRLTVAPDGTATLDQMRAIKHADTTNPDDSVSLASTVIRLTATVVDGDGDSASATISMGNALVFRDDGPIIDAASADTNSIQLTTADGNTRGAAFDTATANFAGAFSVASASFGADGPASGGQVSWSYSLAMATADATTALTSNGVPVTLALVSGEILGSAGGTPIFSISVNSATGIVTLKQFAEIDHPLPGVAGSYASQFIELATGLVELRGMATITDRDGDRQSDTAVLDLGGNIRFADDGPSVSAGGTAPNLVVDESDLSANAVVDLSGLFAVSTDFGADGPGTAQYMLGVKAGASGLVDARSGEAVILSIEGGVVYGRTASHEVFRISVAGGGIVTFDQSRAVIHAPDAGPDQTLFLSGSNLITLTALVTDGDGDTAAATADITGHFAIRDDAPLAVDDEDNVARDGQSFADGNVLTGIGGSDDNGMDGAADRSGADGQLKVVGVEFAGAAGTIGTAFAGEYGEIIIDADGNYRYQLDAGDPAVIALGADETLTETFFYIVSDADGDTSKAAIRIIITGANDFPIARADTNWVLDGASGSDPKAIGNVLQDIIHSSAPMGLFADVADNDPDLEPITVTSAGTYAGIYGTLVIAADGSYTYTLDEDRAAVNALDTGQTLVDSFAYTISDGTLSVSSSLSITIFGTNDAPMIGTAIARVSEEGLAGGNPDALPNPTLDTTNNVVAAGVLVIADADAGETLTVALGNPGPVLNSGGVPVTWAGVGTGTLIGSAGGVEVIRITIAPNGAYNVTLSKPVDHSASGTEDIKSFFVPVSVFDGSVTTTNVGAIEVVIEDDAPAAAGETGTSAQPAQDVNTLFILDFSDSIDSVELDTMIGAVQGALTQLDAAGTGAMTIRFVIFSSGAFASPTFASAADANAYLDGLNPLAGGERPSAEQIGLNTNYSGAIQTALANFSAIPGASNQVFFLSDGNPNQQVQFAGIPPVVVNSLTPVVASAWNSFIDGNGVNVTAIGIDNNPLQPLNIQRLRDIDVNDAPGNNPILVDDFQDLVSTLLSVIVPSAVTGDLDANDAFGGDGGRILSIAVGGTTYIWDGTSSIAVSTGGSIAGSTLNAVATPMGGTLTLNFATGQYLYQPPTPITVTATETFSYVLTDRDGDTASANLSITITALAPPIVIDLDGDGVEFVSSAANVAFDYDGDGVAETTAWAGRDDGLLAIDKNGNAKIDNGSELVFGKPGVSDLEGLARSYDSNGDGKLDAADKDFAKFGIWQDANCNGVTDPGEYRSLVDAQIVSISLVSDNRSYTAANGEVQVRGEATYTRADGSTGKLADAAFATNFAAEQQRTAPGSTGLSAAMLAAGLVAAAPLAAQPTAAPLVDAAPPLVTAIAPEAAGGAATSAERAGMVHEFWTGPETIKIGTPEDDAVHRSEDPPQSELALTADMAEGARPYGELPGEAETDDSQDSLHDAAPVDGGELVQQVLPEGATPDPAAATPGTLDAHAASDQAPTSSISDLVTAALEGPSVDLGAILGSAGEAAPPPAAMLSDAGSWMGESSALLGQTFVMGTAEQHAAVQLEQAAAAGQA